MGKQLIEVLQSNAKVEVKRESIRDFRYILERTSEHPMMREYYGRTKEKMMQIREMPYILNEIIEALQMEFEL